MDAKELESKIGAFIDSVPEDKEEMVSIDTSPVVDLWQQRRRTQRDLTPTAVKGASPRMQLDLTGLLAGPILDAYKKTKEDCELLRAEGETERARLLEQQYMQDYYYPAVDALVRMNSRDQVLASQDALEALDSLAMVPGGGDTTGYASVFVSSLYEPLNGVISSDAQVRDAIRQVEDLCGRGQVRQAASVAKRMQDNIDYGKNVATPEDYELLQKVVLRTQ